jgi:hypothetical protein
MSAMYGAARCVTIAPPVRTLATAAAVRMCAGPMAAAPDVAVLMLTMFDDDD